jgi:hypothetical protein
MAGSLTAIQLYLNWSGSKISLYPNPARDMVNINISRSPGTGYQGAALLFIRTIVTGENAEKCSECNDTNVSPEFKNRHVSHQDHRHPYGKL